MSVSHGPPIDSTVVKTSRQIEESSALQFNQLNVLKTFLLLGFRAFGGSKHRTNQFRAEFVYKKPWIEETEYNELVTLCNTLPGPSTIQLVLALGAMWLGGLKGALLLIILYLFPAFLLTYLSALFFRRISDVDPRLLSPQWYTEFGPVLPLNPLLSTVSEACVGLPPVAMACFLGNSLLDLKDECLDEFSAILIVMSALLSQSLPLKTIWWAAPLLMLMGGLSTFLESHFHPSRPQKGRPAITSKQKPTLIEKSKPDLPPISRFHAKLFLALFFVGAIAAFALGIFADFQDAVKAFSMTLRSVCCAFGGDYIILPAIRSELENLGSPPTTILAISVALAHIFPGHMFLVFVFVGSYGFEIGGGLFVAVAVLAPSILLTLGCLPFWTSMKQQDALMRFMRGARLASLGICCGFSAHFFLQSVKGTGPLCVSILCVSLIVLLKVPQQVACLASVCFGWLLLQVNIGGPYCWVINYTQRFPEFSNLCLNWNNVEREIHNLSLK